MNRSFLITPGYKLSGAEYSDLVKGFSNTTPKNSINGENLQNRFISLIDSNYIQNSDTYLLMRLLICREYQLYVIPPPNDAKLILAYENIIVRMSGRFEIFVGITV